MFLKSKSSGLFLTAFLFLTLNVLASTAVLPNGLGPKTDPEKLGFEKKSLEKLDEVMKGMVEKNQVAGLSYALVRKGEVAAFNAFGDLKADSIVRIYSMTKPIVGAALMILYDEGKFQLDDPIAKYIPEFSNLRVFVREEKDGSMVTEPVKRSPTIRELMSHTAGFAYGFSKEHPVEKAYNEAKLMRSKSLEEMVKKIAKLPLKTQPGEEWFYSIAVDIQGYLVEVLSGKTLGKFLRNRIFEPLGMKDTGFFIDESMLYRLASVYQDDEVTKKLVLADPSTRQFFSNYKEPPPIESGGAGLVSTLADYGRFCQMILNKGEFEGKRVLSENSVSLMGTNVVPLEVLEANRTILVPGYGFGLDFAVVIHPGEQHNLPVGAISWGGAAATWFWIDPANDLYFVGLVQKFARDRPWSDQSQKLVYEALINP